MTENDQVPVPSPTPAHKDTAPMVLQAEGDHSSKNKKGHPTRTFSEASQRRLGRGREA